MPRFGAIALKRRAHRTRQDRFFNPVAMRLNVHGRFQLEILRDRDPWIAYRIGKGTRVPDPDVVIPASAQPDEIPTFLDDIFRELAGPGTTIRVLGGTRLAFERVRSSSGQESSR
jgi:hypothetical protein